MYGSCNFVLRVADIVVVLTVVDLSGGAGAEVHQAFLLLVDLVLEEAVLERVQVADPIIGTVIVEPGGPYLVGEVHSLLVLAFEGDPFEDLPVVACPLEQSLDSDGQLHLNVAAVCDPDPSPCAELPGKVVVEDDLLGDDPVLSVLDGWEEHFVHEYVHIQVLLVVLGALGFCRLHLLQRGPVHRRSPDFLRRSIVKAKLELCHLSLVHLQWGRWGVSEVIVLVVLGDHKPVDVLFEGAAVLFCSLVYLLFLDIISIHRV